MKRITTIIATATLVAALLPTLPAVANDSTPTTNSTHTTTINQRSDIQPQTRARKKTKTRTATLSLTVTHANNGNKPTIRVRSNAQKVRVTAWNTSGKRYKKTFRVKRTKDLKKISKVYRLPWNRVTKIQATTVAVTVGKGKKSTRLTVNKKTRTIKVRATKPGVKPSNPATPGSNGGVWVDKVPAITVTHYSLNSVKLTVRANSTFSGCYLVVQTRPAGGTWEGTNIENSCGTHTGQQVDLNKSGGHEFRARLVHVNQDWEEKPASNYSPTVTITQPTLAQFWNTMRPHLETALLNAHNTARATGRMCGSTWMPAAPALTLNSRLTQAANTHAQDMYTNGFMSHTGSNGSTPTQRAQTAGYNGTYLGENIDGVYPSIQNVFTEGTSTMNTAPDVATKLATYHTNRWLNSPGHCANLMNSVYQHVGFSSVESAPAVAMFGRP